MTGDWKLFTSWWRTKKAVSGSLDGLMWCFLEKWTLLLSSRCVKTLETSIHFLHVHPLSALKIYCPLNIFMPNFVTFLVFEGWYCQPKDSFVPRSILIQTDFCWPLFLKAAKLCICCCVHWRYLVLHVYELITCVGWANESAGNVISAVDFWIIKNYVHSPKWRWLEVDIYRHQNKHYSVKDSSKTIP